METTLVLVIVVALLFDFVNGWNDSANAIATVISTRVMPPMVAVLFAAVLNFFGALWSQKVAKMIGSGLLDPDMIAGKPEVLLAAMLAAAGWVAVCTRFGMPISGSHALIGGMIGAALAFAGIQAIQIGGILLVLIAMLAAPILGFVVGYILLVAVYWIANLMRPRTVRRAFSFLQVLSSGVMAWTHGTNDAQKVMGVIMLALVLAHPQDHSFEDPIPVWVILSCAVVMGLGTAAGGQRVIRTLGMRLAHIRPIEGFAAETGAGLVLSVTAALGLPVSTTHTIAGGILGVGTAYRAKTVKWGIGAKMVWAWIATLPAAALLAMIVGWIWKLFAD